jgi:hypothetical protein
VAEDAFGQTREPPQQPSRAWPKSSLSSHLSAPPKRVRTALTSRSVNSCSRERSTRGSGRRDSRAMRPGASVISPAACHPGIPQCQARPSIQPAFEASALALPPASLESRRGYPGRLYAAAA